MRNYDEKIFYFATVYPWLFTGEKPDLDHILPQTKANRIRCPHFIDSILNLRPLKHGDHMNHRPRGYTYFHADIYEKILEASFYLRGVLNCDMYSGAADILAAIDEAENFYCGITQQKKGAYTEIFLDTMKKT